MTTPDFNDLTPPDELVREWFRCDSSRVTSENHWRHIATEAARWGARHGYEQARQLWPEPITDRPPTEDDGDEEGIVQVISSPYKSVWARVHWSRTLGRPWLHTPRWQPRQPTLQEQALADVDHIAEHSIGGDLVARLNRIRRALRQAGEGVENE